MARPISLTQNSLRGDNSLRVAYRIQQKLTGDPEKKVDEGPCAVTICKGMKCLENQKGNAVCVKAFSEMTCAQDIPPISDWVRQSADNTETENHMQHRSVSNTYLHDACKNGDLCRVKKILSEDKVDMNTRDRHGMTPLMVAGQRADIQVFYFLLIQGASLTIINFAQENILHLACEGGNIQIVKFVLQQNITDVNSRRQDGSTPAIIAVHEGHGEVFTLLVSEGADLALCDDKGSAVVYQALKLGNTELVKYLFKHRWMAINKKYNRLRPVIYAAINGKLDLYNFLVDKGAVLPSDGTILQRICKGGNIDMVKHALAQNIDSINYQGGWDRTAAMEAAIGGHGDVFDLLLEKGADLSLTDAEDSNVLHLAIEGGNVNIVKNILRKQIETINATNVHGVSPAVKAAVLGHKEIFFLLISKAATIKKNEELEHQLHYACKGGNVDIVKYFLTQYSADINKEGRLGCTPAMYAVFYGHIEVVNLLARKGADLTQENNSHDNILSLAIQSEHPEIVKYIVKEHTVDINRENTKGMTPVMIAAEKGLEEVFHLLVSRGADLTKINEKKENILHSACRRMGMETVEYILTQNIVEDINTRTSSGETPLMIAAANGNKGVFDLLLKKGANLTLLDENGNNLLLFASKGGSIEIVKYILSLRIQSINNRCDKGLTAVMTAARYGNRAVFHVLVENGANPSFHDTDDNDILYLACLGKNINIVKYITGIKGLRFNITRAIEKVEEDTDDDSPLLDLLRDYRFMQNKFPLF